MAVERIHRNWMRLVLVEFEDSIFTTKGSDCGGPQPGRLSIVANLNPEAAYPAGRVHLHLEGEEQAVSASLTPAEARRVAAVLVSAADQTEKLLSAADRVQTEREAQRIEVD